MDADLSRVLDELDALEAKATKEPWVIRELRSDCFVEGAEVVGKTVAGEYRREILSDEQYDKKHADAHLIAALRNAYPLLRDALRKEADRDL